MNDNIVSQKRHDLEPPAELAVYGEALDCLLEAEIPFLFGYIYPSHRGLIPAWVQQALLHRLGESEEEDALVEMSTHEAPHQPLCRGTLLSRTRNTFLMSSRPGTEMPAWSPTGRCRRSR